MNIDLIPIGKNPPEDVNVVIEVPVGGEPIKYEMDKKSGSWLRYQLSPNWRSHHGR